MSTKIQHRNENSRSITSKILYIIFWPIIKPKRLFDKYVIGKFFDTYLLLNEDLNIFFDEYYLDQYFFGKNNRVHDFYYSKISTGCLIIILLFLLKYLVLITTKSGFYNFFYFFNSNLDDVFDESKIDQLISHNLLNKLQYISSKREEADFAAKLLEEEDSFDGLFNFFLRTIHIGSIAIYFLLFLLSISNAYTLYNKSYRKYGLMLRDATDMDLIPNSENIEVETVNFNDYILDEEEISYIMTDEEDDEIANRGSFYIPGRSNAHKQETNSLYDSGEKLFWNINVWNPSKIRLYLLCFLSPFTTISIYFFIESDGTSANIKVLLLNLLFSAFTFSLIFKKFLPMANDTKIIHEDVNREYQLKYVQPTIDKLEKNNLKDNRRWNLYGEGKTICQRRPFEVSTMNEQFQLIHKDENILKENVKRGMIMRRARKNALQKTTIY